MGSLSDKIAKLPKWAVLAIGGIGIMFAGYMVYRSFAPAETGAPIEEKTPGGVMLGMTDADEKAREEDGSRLSAYDKARFSAHDFWDSDLPVLEEKAGETPGSGGNDGGLRVGSGGGVPIDDNGNVYLDPSEYSEMEMYLIRSGYKSRADIDREHEKDRQRQAVFDAAKVQTSSITMQSSSFNQNSDSAYFARLERTMEIAQKYSGQPAMAEPEPEPEPEERRIDVSPSGRQGSIPLETLQDDGIVTSLSQAGYSGGIIRGGDGRVNVRPCRATFLNTEKISSGQRVIIRLLEDLTLADGVQLPANTHLTGTCSLGKRLNIHISMVHYAGKMLPVSLDAFDVEGTEGIYCPVTENKMKESGQNVAGNGIAAVGSVASTVLGATAGYAGRVLGQVGTAVVSEISRSISRDGTVSINVSSGYEFYIYEDLGKED